MSKTLANAFNITNSNLLKLNDYEIFQDKEALEKIKNDITFSLIDEVSLGLKETDIHSKVDEYTKSLNLSTLEKQYLYNLIDNEIYSKVKDYSKERHKVIICAFTFIYDSFCLIDSEVKEPLHHLI